MFRSLLLLTSMVLTFAACERKPNEEEVQAEEKVQEKAAEQKRAAEQRVATPPPKPGDWMWKKDRKSPLDEKAKKGL